MARAPVDRETRRGSEDWRQRRKNRIKNIGTHASQNPSQAAEDRPKRRSTGTTPSPRIRSSSNDGLCSLQSLSLLTLATS